MIFACFQLTAGHLLLQRQKIAHPHDHSSEQASQAVGKRRHPVLDEVTMR